MIDNSQQTQKRLQKLQSILQDNSIITIWKGFGSYIQKQLSSGRGVKVPGFGLFTFSHPKGRINPSQQDKLLREPIFIINKDFLQGNQILSGILNQNNHFRSISLQNTSRSTKIVQLNYSEISLTSGLENESVKVGLSKVFEYLSTSAKCNGKVSIDIPLVGQFEIRSGIALIKFNQQLINESAIMVTSTISEQIQKRSNTLQNDYHIKELEFDDDNNSPGTQNKSLLLDRNAKRWLRCNLDLSVSDIVTNNSEAKSTISQHSSFLSYQMQSQKKKNINNYFTMDCQSIQSNATSSQNKNNKDDNSKIIDLFRQWVHLNFISLDIAYNKIYTELNKRLLNGEQFKPEILQIVLLKLGFHFSSNLSINPLFDALAQGGVQLKYGNFKSIFPNQENNSDKKLVEDQLETSQNMLSLRRQKIKELLESDQINLILLINYFEKQYQKDTQSVISIDQLEQALATNCSHNQGSNSSTISSGQFKNLANLIVNQKQGIEREILLAQLKQIKLEVDVDQSWNFKTKQKIISRINRMGGGFHLFQNRIKEMDPHNTGYISMQQMLKIFQIYNIDLNCNSIAKLLKTNSDNKDLLQYQKFCDKLNQMMNTSDNYKDEQIEQLVENLLKYIKQYKEHNFFIQAGKVDGVTVEQGEKISQFFFKVFARKQILQDQSQAQFIDQLFILIDVDKDGFIDKYDLQNFVGRYQLHQSRIAAPTPQDLTQYDWDQTEQELPKTCNQSIFKTQPSPQEVNTQSLLSVTQKQKKSLASIDLSCFDVKPISEQQLDNFKSIFRKTIFEKKLSNFDVFNILDQGNKGFVTLLDFCQGLDKIMNISQTTKEGLFAYFDNKKIGMFNYQRFLCIINQPLFSQPQLVYEDNFDWQMQVLDQIKRWYFTQNISCQQAFQIIDADFDGVISKQDLHQFLISCLNFSKENLVDLRLDRLYKLLDKHKRGFIQIKDLADFLFSGTGQSQISPAQMRMKGYQSIQGSNQINTEGQQSNISMSPYYRQQLQQNQEKMTAKVEKCQENQTIWVNHARVQLGLALSRQFQDAHQSFEFISKNRNRIVFDNFKEWIEKSNVMKGFNLTDSLMQQFFAGLDPHKKGFLSEDDWRNNFQNIKYSSQLMQEVQELIQCNFSNTQEAYQALSQGLAEVTKQNLQIFLEKLLPGRFSEVDREIIWSQLLQGGSGQSRLKREDLQNNLFLQEHALINTPSPQDKKNRSKSEQSSNTFVTPEKERASSVFKYNSMMQHCSDLIERLRNILKYQTQNLEQVFKENDPNNTGMISQLLFRNCLKQLTIGLKITDLDAILNIFQYQDNPRYVNWPDFIKRMKLTDPENRLERRANKKIEELKKDLYQYLISPKDAFNRFNSNRTGLLDIKQFTNMMNEIASLACKQQPSFQIIKEIFEFIDVNKNGFIDLRKWVEALNKDNNDNCSETQITEGQWAPKVYSYRRARNINKPIQRMKDAGEQEIFASRNQNRLHPHRLKIVDFGQTENLKKDLQLDWKSSKHYDQILRVIGKNRKHILEKLKSLEHQNKYVCFQDARDVIKGFLEASNIHLSEKGWVSLLSFAYGGQKLDVDFMMSVFKERLENLTKHPLF